jgi:hypothetical protein
MAIITTEERKITKIEITNIQEIERLTQAVKIADAILIKTKPTHKKILGIMGIKSESNYKEVQKLVSFTRKFLSKVTNEPF